MTKVPKSTRELREAKLPREHMKFVSLVVIHELEFLLQVEL